MIFARNQVDVGPEYTPEATFLLDRSVTVPKLSVRVVEHPVTMQITEQVEQFFDDPYNTEFELNPGFHGLSFVTEITGWRFRAGLGGLPSVIFFRANG